MKIEFENKIIEFDLIYRKRKTLSILVNTDGTIKVTVPFKVSKEEVLKIVSSKGRWILKKQNEIKSINKNKVVRKFENGGIFMYLGNNYTLKLEIKESIKNISVRLLDNNLIIKANTYNKEKIKLAIEKWYREKTLEKAVERVKYYSRYFSEYPKEIKAKEQKLRWGSCTYDNKLLFNWRIAMAPIDIFDYIIVHEMCHMEYKNHSKEYWNRVCEILPNYKEKIKWLKKNGINLSL